MNKIKTKIIGTLLLSLVVNSTLFSQTAKLNDVNVDSENSSRVVLYEGSKGISDKFISNIEDLTFQYYSLMDQYRDNKKEPTIKRLKENGRSYYFDFTENNSLMTTYSGEMSAFYKKSLISLAKKSIEISGAYCSGVNFLEILNLIEGKLKNNVKTFLLCTTVAMDKDVKDKLEQLVTDYPTVFKFAYTRMRFTFSGKFKSIENHEKMLLIDETFLQMGGTNMTDSTMVEGLTPDEKVFMYQKTRDMDVVGFGPVIKQARLEFFKVFSIWKHQECLDAGNSKKAKIRFANYRGEENCQIINEYYPVNKNLRTDNNNFDNAVVYNEYGVDNITKLFPRLVTNVKTRLLFTTPNDKGSYYTDYIESNLINSAKEEIVIANLFLNPTKKFMSAIMDATNRGVSMTIITNGKERAPTMNRFFVLTHEVNYLPIVYGSYPNKDDVKKSDFDMKNNDVSIYEYNVDYILYHKKSFVIDNKIALVGSFNLGKKSSYGDFEASLEMHSPQMASEVKKVILTDIPYSRKIDKDEIKRLYIKFYNTLSVKFENFVSRFI